MPSSRTRLDVIEKWAHVIRSKAVKVLDVSFSRGLSPGADRVACAASARRRLGVALNPKEWIRCVSAESELRVRSRWSPCSQMVSAHARSRRAGNRIPARRGCYLGPFARVDEPTYFLASRSRISPSKTSWAGGGAGAAGASSSSRLAAFMALTSMKTAKATMMKVMTLLMKRP